jgi:hypothetical protein
MFKKTLIAFSAMVAMGITVPGFAENANKDNLETHEANRDAHEDNRDDNAGTVHQNAKDARQDDRDEAKDDQNLSETGVSVKRDSKGRKCVYFDNDGERHVRNSCK